MVLVFEVYTVASPAYDARSVYRADLIESLLVSLSCHLVAIRRSTADKLLPFIHFTSIYIFEACEVSN